MARKKKINSITPPKVEVHTRKRVSARTPNQKQILRAIKNNDITICSAAIEYLSRGEVEKIVVTRPIVQAGERIGFLPGTAEQKLDPYLYPVFDEFAHFLSYSDIATLKNARKIEIVPLALMRGRNFHNAFIIGDEMQNATFEQLKMFITRMGIDSRLVISGDITQSDLPKRDQGAFDFCFKKLHDIKGVKCCQLEGKDIVRNPIIPLILERLDDR